MFRTSGALVHGEFPPHHNQNYHLQNYYSRLLIFKLDDSSPVRCRCESEVQISALKFWFGVYNSKILLQQSRDR